MDNFMDKLAQRITAQEMIKANSQAEAQELQRLREQVKAYDECLQEMRGLNLKNTEAAEQIRALAEQVNGLVKQAVTVVNDSAAREDGLIDDTRKSVQELQAELRSAQEALGKLQADGQTFREEISSAMDRLDASLQENKETTAQKLEESGKVSAGMEEFMHKESVRVYRNVQAVLLDEIKNQTKELNEKIGQSGKKDREISAVLAATMLFSLASLGILVAQLMGIL